MKAILLAAGFGTRLRPLTDIVPKCLVPIHGIPLLEIWLERLSACGVDSFLVNTHYLHNEVASFINSSRYKESVTIVHEKTLLGTAGTLISNIDFFNGEDGLMIHADNYCLADFTKFMQCHLNRPEHCLMTMMIFRTETPSSCGIVELNKQGVVIDFHEKVEKPPSNLANGAIYILSAKLLEILSEDLNYAKDFSNEVLHRFIGRIFSYETHDQFMDIGTPESYSKANSL